MHKFTNINPLNIVLEITQKTSYETEDQLIIILSEDFFYNFYENYK